MTAKLALQILEKEGIVYRMARRGTFLSDNKASRSNVTEKNSNWPVYRFICHE